METVRARFGATHGIDDHDDDDDYDDDSGRECVNYGAARQR